MEFIPGTKLVGAVKAKGSLGAPKPEGWGWEAWVGGARRRLARRAAKGLVEAVVRVHGHQILINGFFNGDREWRSGGGGGEGSLMLVVLIVCPPCSASGERGGGLTGVALALGVCSHAPHAVKAGRCSCGSLARVGASHYPA
jgi:hypothetical protein